MNKTINRRNLFFNAVAALTATTLLRKTTAANPPLVKYYTLRYHDSRFSVGECRWGNNPEQIIDTILTDTREKGYYISTIYVYEYKQLSSLSHLSQEEKRPYAVATWKEE